MGEAEFDAVSANYRQQHEASVAFSGFELDYFARYKAEVTRARCDKAGLEPRAIMDFGAGVGNALKPLRSEFPDAAIHCVDVSAESLRQCEALNVRNSTVQVYDGETLPFRTGSMDVVFTACVFHHIAEADHVRLLAELRRCLRPEGMMVLFEHNPFNPLTQLAVARCPFDDDAVLIRAGEMKSRFRSAGFSSVRSGFRIFMPAFMSRLQGLEPYMERLPFGGQYYVSARA